MNNKRLILISLILLLLLAACGGSDGYLTGSDDSGDFAYAEEPANEFFDDESAAFDSDGFQRTNATGSSAAGIPPADPASTTAGQNQVQRLIIRTGFMSIDVTDTEASVADIATLADTMGGWVVSTEISQYGARKSGNIVIRVEAAQFDAALIEIRELAVVVNSESTSGQDVTEEYVDLSARLSNLEATADRVRTFLDEATNTEDALAVNRELSQLESEIEVIKGRLNYLSQSATYSTINVSLFPDSAGEPIEVAGWRPEGVAKDAVEALVITLQIVANIVIWLSIYILPLLMLGVLPLYLVFRLIRRWRNRRRLAAAAAAAAE